MPRSLLALLVALFLAGPSWSQEEPPRDPAGETVSSETGEAGEAGEIGETDEPDEADEADSADDEQQIVDPDFDDAGLDEQTYDEDDDDFVPSEEIPADEPIPFPSNI